MNPAVRATYSHLADLMIRDRTISLNPNTFTGRCFSGGISRQVKRYHVTKSIGNRRLIRIIMRSASSSSIKLRRITIGATYNSYFISKGLVSP